MFAKMKKKKQYAALPYHSEGNRLRVLLVTSRKSRRWIIPKGWPMKNHKPHQTAAIEAFEEAGVIGTTERQPIGAYDYTKRLEDGSGLLCKVTVFPLAVASLANEWPEAGERERRWCDPQEAVELVGEPNLARILRVFALEQ